MPKPAITYLSFLNIKAIFLNLIYTSQNKLYNFQLKHRNSILFFPNNPFWLMDFWAKFSPLRIFI